MVATTARGEGEFEAEGDICQDADEREHEGPDPFSVSSSPTAGPTISVPTT
jgi:hypothetical protein